MLIGYARVSTQDQDASMQVAALKDAGCERVFVETASGMRKDRPELALALSHLRQGDTLVVWKMDRLARSLKQLIDTVDELKSKGIGFRSLTQHIDTSTPEGKVMFHFFAVIAEFERDMIRERTMAGLEQARSMGRKGGRPSSVNKQKIAAAQAMLATNHDMTVVEIARQLGISSATLYRHLPAARYSVRQTA